MGIEEIRSSGLLELYVMDQLTPAEKAEVEGYLNTYPQLKKDIKEIEASLELVATGAARQAPPGLKDKILTSIRNDSTIERPGSTSNGINALFTRSVIAFLFSLGILLVGYFYWQKSKQVTRLEQILITQRDSCEQNTRQLNSQLQLLQQLTFPDNKIIPFRATPSFASTDLYLHHNAATKRNFIQVRNLPSIAANQSYQLWSLKPDQAPAPLDVFDVPADGLIEVQFVDETQTYAITIEPKGGSKSPTLENLIGTATVVSSE